MTEHVHETYQALRTGEAAEADPFPPGEGAPVQYGPQARALALSLRDQRRLSCERAAELINGLAGYAMSQATAVNMALEAENSPAMLLFEAGAKARLAGAPVLRADETGVGTGGKTNWAHVAADDEFSLFCPHAGRGHEGAEAAGIIPERRPDRFLTRDRLQTYFGYDRKRCLCNARLLRDLQKCVDAGGGQKSPSRMQHPLSGLNAQTDAYGGKLPLSLQAGGRRTCETILAEGYAETGGRVLARPPGGKKKRGRIRKTFCRNLLETLDVQEDAVLRFTTDA
ncbi:MAG: transposase, partial [Deltaproteobacteria bacterium]|nr:transposase [Deltaproteobacteria bacterium]